MTEFAVKMLQPAAKNAGYSEGRKLGLAPGSTSPHCAISSIIAIINNDFRVLPGDDSSGNPQLGESSSRLPLDQYSCQVLLPVDMKHDNDYCYDDG